MKALSLAVSSDIRTLPAIRPASLCGMWAVLLTASILYCWLYEVAHGHPIGEIIPTIRWSFQAWVGWMTLSVLWFLSWRSGNKLEKLWQHRRGWVPILVATPLIAVLLEWKVSLLFGSMGWASYRSSNYWILLYERAPWALVASSTLAILSYLCSRRALPTQRAPLATSHTDEPLAAPSHVRSQTPRQATLGNHVHAHAQATALPAVPVQPMHVSRVEAQQGPPVPSSQISARFSLDMQSALSAAPANEVSFASQLSAQTSATTIDAECGVCTRIASPAGQFAVQAVPAIKDAERAVQASQLAPLVNHMSAVAGKQAVGLSNGLVAQMSWPAVQPVERLRIAEVPSVPTLRITTQAGPTDVPATAIEAIIAAENYVDVCLSDGKHYLHRATLQSVGDALESPTLVRVRRSAIVNLDHVQGRLSDWRLRLTSGRIVRIGRTYRAQFEACRPRTNNPLQS